MIVRWMAAIAIGCIENVKPCTRHKLVKKPSNVGDPPALNSMAKFSTDNSQPI